MKAKITISLLIILSAFILPISALAQSMPAVIFDLQFDPDTRIWIGDYKGGIVENEDTEFKWGAIHTGPITWIVYRSDNEQTSLYSEFELFFSRLNPVSVPEEGKDKLELSETELYKHTFPEYKKLIFTDAEITGTGAFRLPPNIGGPNETSFYTIDRDLTKCSESAFISNIDYGDNLCAWVVNAMGLEMLRAGVTTGIHTHHWVMRPAFDLINENVLLAAPVENSKAFLAEVGKLSKIPNVEKGDLKLTFVDVLRGPFEAWTDVPAVQPNGEITIRFSGAKNGSNEYVSLLIVSNDGEVLYYGSLAKDKKEGEVSVTMPSDLTEGTYTLKIFSEQRNSGYVSDLVSPIVSIPLQIRQNVSVTFHENADTEPEAATQQVLPLGEETPLAPNTFVRTGYDFAGWNTLPDGSGDFLEDEAVVVLYDDLDLYAVWEQIPEPEPRPDTPRFFRIWEHCRELPRTGLTGRAAFPKPASVEYIPTGTRLLLPSLNSESEILTIQPLNGNYPVEWLGDNAGLLAGTDLPGEGHSLIAAHNTVDRDSYGPFALLSTMEEGDLFFIQNGKNELKTFRVYDSQKIPAADFEALENAVSPYPVTVTLLTCEDELPEGGYASRRIVTGRLVE